MSQSMFIWVAPNALYRAATYENQKEYFSNKISFEYTNYSRIESTCIMKQERQFWKR